MEAFPFRFSGGVLILTRGGNLGTANRQRESKISPRQAHRADDAWVHSPRRSGAASPGPIHAHGSHGHEWDARRERSQVKWLGIILYCIHGLRFLLAPTHSSTLGYFVTAVSGMCSAVGGLING